MRKRALISKCLLTGRRIKRPYRQQGTTLIGRRMVQILLGHQRMQSTAGLLVKYSSRERAGGPIRQKGNTAGLGRGLELCLAPSDGTHCLERMKAFHLLHLLLPPLPAKPCPRQWLIKHRILHYLRHCCRDTNLTSFRGNT